MTHTESHTTHLQQVMVDRDEEHLKLLGIYHFVVAGLLLLTVIMFVIVPLLVGPGNLGAQLPPGGVAAVQQQLIIGLIVGGLLTFVFAMNGWSLRRHENLITCMILSCLECLTIVLGFSLGGFGLILGISAVLVLRRPSVKELFKRTKTQTVSK